MDRGHAYRLVRGIRYPEDTLTLSDAPSTKGLTSEYVNYQHMKDIPSY